MRTIPTVEFNKEFINKMIFHNTLSSLRRAGAVAEWIEKIESDSHPVIYAILKDKEWTFHCLVSDANRYLLEKSAGGSSAGASESPSSPSPQPASGGSSTLSPDSGAHSAG